MEIVGENGIWLAKVPRFKFLFKCHDALYVAFWRVRIRVMKRKNPK